MNELESKLKYVFKDKALLQTAMNHSSYANEHRSQSVSSNERLEFLGDSVLGQVVASYLFINFPELPEGQMTRLRAELVCEQSLFEVAKSLELGKYICLGRGEEHSGGRNRESILADAVEAVIAALYLDGGLDVAAAFIDRNILSRMDSLRTGITGDWKTALQELIQHNPGSTLEYELESESGPDHNKTFTVRVTLDGRTIGCGSGHTKKEAEQNAARSGLKELSE